MFYKIFLNLQSLSSPSLLVLTDRWHNLKKKLLWPTESPRRSIRFYLSGCFPAVTENYRTVIFNSFCSSHDSRPLEWPSDRVSVRLRRGELQVSERCLTADRCSTKGRCTLYVKTLSSPSGDHPACCLTVRRLVHLDKWKGWDGEDDEHGRPGFYSGRAAVPPGQTPPSSAGSIRLVIGWRLVEYEQAALAHTSPPRPLKT